MEYSILNQILTSTVGSLFQKMPAFQPTLREAPSWINKPQENITKSTVSVRHEKKRSSGDFATSSFLSREESSLDSLPSLTKNIDSLHSKSRSIDHSYDKKSISSLNSLNTSLNSIQPAKSEQEVKPSYSTVTTSTSNSNQHIRQSAAQKNEPPSLDKWIKTNGPQKLNEALANLGLDIRSINRVNLSALSHEQLQNEKKNVKNELKTYDAYFTTVFKRVPEREEKEPMRPLYIYYKKIKQYITKSQERGKGHKATSSSVQGNNMHSDFVSNLSTGSDKAVRSSKTTKGTGIEKENRLHVQDRKLETSFEAQMSRDNYKDRDSHDEGEKFGLHEKYHNKIRGHGGSQLTGNSREQIKKQLEEYRAYRLQLREKLHSYQSDFTRNNNRRIKYHKDIAPVESEYKRYKDIKHEISRLEDLLNSCT